MNFDNTLLKDFATCEAAGIIRHVFGLRSKKEKIAADIGNVFHAALEMHFQGASKAAIMKHFEGKYDLVIPPGEEPEEERFERTNVIKIMERYIDTRPVEKMPFECLETERVIGFELVPGYVFWAKRDMKVKSRITGQIEVVDHKTTHRLTDWFARRHRLTSQLTGYIWATQQETGQLGLKAWVNGIEVAKLPNSNRKCAVHGRKYFECSSEHANFQLYGYTRTPEQIEKWKADALALAKKFEIMKQAFGADLGLVRYALRNGAFNESCMFCEYADWCKADFEPTAAEQYCVYDQWSPWEQPQW